MRPRDERRLLRLMERHGIGEFSCSTTDDEVALTLDGLAPLHPEIRASQAGRFLNRHPAMPHAVFPRRVQAGEIVACLKIGALLLPVTASADAILPPPLFEDGTVVGYGDVLF